MTDSDQQLLYSVDQAREVLGGVSRSALYELMADGRIKATKLGRRTYFRRDELVAFVSRL